MFHAEKKKCRLLDNETSDAVSSTGENSTFDVEVHSGRPLIHGREVGDEPMKHFISREKKLVYASLI